MPSAPLETVVRRLRHALVRDGGELTDEQLLMHYVVQRDDGAFEALVRRHGPTVLGVCNRVLGNLQDAEDAFQATFLVLVKKAPSIRKAELLGNWLYGVACRTAMKARAMKSKRRAREQEARDMRTPDSQRERFWSELQPLLDQELHALADKYRMPILMCDLERRSRREVAEKLGWPEGTVATRLAMGRTLLAKRLARHGVTLSGGTLAMVVAEHVVSATVPASLVMSTIRAANVIVAGSAVSAGAIAPNVAALTEEVLKTTALAKLRTAAVGLIVIGILGVGLVLTEFRGQSTAAHMAKASTEAIPDRPQRAPVELPNHVAAPLAEKSEVRAPLPEPPQDPPTNPLDKILMEWESATTQWQTFAGEVQRIRWEKDKIAEARLDTAPFLRGQGDTSTRASLYVWRMKPAPGTDRDELHYSMQYLPGLSRIGPPPEMYGYERYLRSESGSFLYTSGPTEKVLRARNLPAPVPGKFAGDNFLGFLFDMRAAEAKNRFKVSYIGDNPEKPDIYHRLKIVPLQAQDREDFTEARVVLNANNLLPRQLWLRRPDGSTVTWNFLKADANVEVPLSEFDPPPLPEGWTLEQVPGKKT